MAKRKTKRTININHKDFSVEDLFKKGLEDAPLEHLLAAYAKVEHTENQINGELKKLDILKKALSDHITGAHYDDLIKKLVSRGILWDTSETPIVRLENADGSVYNIYIAKDAREVVEISSVLSQKNILDTIDPRYKKINITLDKTLVKNEFKAGVLPSSLSMFCSYASTDGTKLKTVQEKGPTKKDKEE